MEDSLERVGESKPVRAVTKLIDPTYLLAMEGSAGHYDPHVWMDVSAWAKCVEAVGDELATFDPAHADDYQANAADLISRLDALHRYGRERIASIPERRRVLITSHDAFNYFGRAYGMEVRGVQGISTESEAGLHDINALVDFIAHREINAVFVETSVAQKNIRALIEGAASKGQKVRIGGELFSDAMGEAGTYEGTYIGMLDHNITIVTRALGGEAPARGLNGRLKHPGEPESGG
jgi:manganese/zinc/iron transport system substrate-binding protein